MFSCLFPEVVAVVTEIDVFHVLRVVLHIDDVVFLALFLLAVLVWTRDIVHMRKSRVVLDIGVNEHRVLDSLVLIICADAEAGIRIFWIFCEVAIFAIEGNASFGITDIQHVSAHSTELHCELGILM